jgi:hypothetical protein
LQKSGFKINFSISQELQSNKIKTFSGPAQNADLILYNLTWNPKKD